MRFFQVPARKWWWGLIGLAVLAGLIVADLLISSVVMIVVMLAEDPEWLSRVTEGGVAAVVTTPSIFLINNVALAVIVPACVLVSWLFYRQGFGWLVSVTGRFRWKWWGLVMGVMALGYLVIIGVQILVFGLDGAGYADMHYRDYTWFVIISIVLTTPLQCAGEEFGLRGLLPRLITGIVPFRWVGLVLAALLSSAVFAWLHGAQDPWLNVYYFSFGMMAWWLAYRTGGIEAGIALHIVNNVTSEANMPFTDFSGMFNREAGTADWTILILLGMQLVLVVIVDIIARRRGLVRLSAPAAAIPLVVKPRRWVTRLADSTEVATIADLPRLDKTPREPAPMVALPPNSLWPTPVPAAPDAPYAAGQPGVPVPTGGPGPTAVPWSDRPGDSAQPVTAWTPAAPPAQPAQPPPVPPA